MKQAAEHLTRGLGRLSPTTQAQQLVLPQDGAPNNCPTCWIGNASPKWHCVAAEFRVAVGCVALCGKSKL